jgi:aminoglycoside 3-N-acetyltransferase I
MDPKTRALLERIYRPENEVIDVRRDVYTHRTKDVTREELAYLAKVGFPPNDHVKLTHDEAVTRLCAAAKKLRLRDVARAFVAGVGGSAPRERQTLISYAFAAHLPAAPHDRGENGKKGGPCGTCSCATSVWLDRTDERLGWWRGGAWNELPTGWVLDLEERAQRSGATPTDDDIARFAALLALVDAQPAGTTPGALDKVVARAKVLTEKDKYRRYGLFEALAMVGVLPNPLVPSWLDRWTTFDEICALSKKAGGGPRSDLVLPFGAWRGGVDWPRVLALFPEVHARAHDARKALASAAKPSPPAARAARDASPSKPAAPKIMRLSLQAHAVAARRLFTMMAHELGEPACELTRGHVTGLITRDDFWVIGAFEGGEPIGGLTAHALPMTRHAGRELFVYDVAVRRDRRRLGIGRKLFDTLRALAAADGMHDVFVAVDDEDTHALDFYRALGADASKVTMFTFGPPRASAGKR